MLRMTSTGCFSYKVDFKTTETLQFIDITEDVEKIISDSCINGGLINIQSLHTTVAIVVNENEPLLIVDMKNSMEKLAAQSCNYNHDNFKIRTVNMCKGECANGHAHCKALLLPTSVTLNIINGNLQLGKWQRIFVVELDRGKERSVSVQLIGVV